MLDEELDKVKCVIHERIQLDGVREAVDKMVEEEFQKAMMEYLINQIFNYSSITLESVKFQTGFDNTRMAELVSNKLRSKNL